MASPTRARESCRKTALRAPGRDPDASAFTHPEVTAIVISWRSFAHRRLLVAAPLDTLDTRESEAIRTNPTQFDTIPHTHAPSDQPLASRR